MNHMMRVQISGARNCGFADFHRPMRIALLLNRRTASPADRACDTSPKHQVVVRRVDDRVDMVIDEVAFDDHDPRRMHASTSATRSSSCSSVALAMPLTPIDVMVIDAQAVPHTSASCSPPG